tara:strand:+ start:201 stop:425 length:225 start_codon:yes stop_codon:yes gene_type:complete
MEDKNLESPQSKIKIDNHEYLLDTLPDEAKQLVNGLKAADIQIRMYEDTLKLISISRTKLIEDLRKILEEIEPN